MKKPSVDDYEVTKDRIIHRPTRAWWGPSFKGAEPDGDEYDYEEVQRMALTLRERRPA